MLSRNKIKNYVKTAKFLKKKFFNRVKKYLALSCIALKASHIGLST